jgi:1,4-dihydroxy-2-naphthoate octaprenyltransferase
MSEPIWYRSLSSVSPLKRDIWDRMNILQRWSYFAVAASLPMSVLPALYVGLLAWRDGDFNLVRWIALVVGLVFAHATNNMANDITDFWRKVDEGDFTKMKLMPPPLHLGYLPLRSALVYLTVTGVIALAAGIYLLLQSGPLTLWLLVVGSVFVLFYTFPLKLIGLGEITVLLVWGPMMVAGGYYVVAGSWNWSVLIASLPFALSASMVLIGRHLDKIDADRKRGIRSLPVWIGEQASRILMLVMLAFQYLIVIFLVGSGSFSPWLLVALFGLLLAPQVVPVFLHRKPVNKPDGVPENAWHLWFIAPAQFNNLFFGLTFLVALLLEVVL